MTTYIHDWLFAESFSDEAGDSRPTPEAGSDDRRNVIAKGEGL